jgi:DNA-binding IclR family transcriptional regulator
MEALPRYGNIQVIDRAVRILDAVSERGSDTLSSIGAQVSLPLSTASRILDSLARHAFVERDDDGNARSRWYLGDKLSGQYLKHLD